MNRAILSKRISSLLAEVSRLSNALCAMNTIDLQRYPENYELLSTDAALRAESREAAESILTREITEAVAADPYGRCAYIESLAFDWTAPDAIRVDTVLHGIDAVTIDLTAYITKGDA